MFISAANCTSLVARHWSGLPESILFACTGMKEYSQWPTFPQVYIGGEFVGGADIMIRYAKKEAC
jgi:hypothetical protein